MKKSELRKLIREEISLTKFKKGDKVKRLSDGKEGVVVDRQYRDLVDVIFYQDYISDERFKIYSITQNPNNLEVIGKDLEILNSLQKSWDNGYMKI